MPEINVPFPGLYESMLSGAIDRAEETTVESLRDHDSFDVDGLEDHEIAGILFDHTDYDKVHQIVARKWVEAFDNYVADELDLQLGLEFTIMVSPREYNFTTDRVFANISDESLAALFELVDKAELDRVCEEHLKSRSGFISHYDYHWREWGPLEDWDYNQLGMLLHALLPGREWMWSVCDRMYEDIDNALDEGQDWDRIQQKLDEAVMEKRGEVEPDDREFPVGVSDPADYVRQYDEMNHLKRGEA